MFDPEETTMDTFYFRSAEGWWTERTGEPKIYIDGECAIGPPATGYTVNELEAMYRRAEGLQPATECGYLQSMLVDGIRWWSEDGVPICPMADRMSYRLDPNKKHYPTPPPIQAVGV